MKLIAILESYLGRFLLWTACVMLAATLYANKTATPGVWDAGDWAAFAAVVTAMVAVVAVGVAAIQLKDARELRWEQAQPYVAAYLEPDETDPKLIYLAIKNFGATVATDVTLAITPDPQRSDEVGGGPLWYPELMPALVPGQEWRTFWDFSVARYDAGMTDRHVLTIGYSDSRNKRHSMDSVLDWESFTSGRRWIGRKNIHHLSTALEKLEKHASKFAASAKTVATAASGHTTAQPPGAGGSEDLPDLASVEALEQLGITHEVEPDPGLEAQGPGKSADSSED